MKYEGPKVTDLPSPATISTPVLTIWLCLVMAFLIFVFAGVQRYPVGQPVPASVYTEPFDPCDPAYKFLQAPPKDWADKFGNNERTALIHAISELRVVVAAQGKRLMVLEAIHKDELTPKDPNEVEK